MNPEMTTLLSKYPLPWSLEETRLRRGTLQIVVVDSNGFHVFVPAGETADEIRQMGMFLIAAAKAFAQ